MYDVIEEFANENIIICGDFNLVQNQDLDTHNRVNINNPRAKSGSHLRIKLNGKYLFKTLYKGG